MKKQTFEVMSYVSPCARVVETRVQQPILAASIVNDESNMPEYSEEDITL